jgi:hypothetical protein
MVTAAGFMTLGKHLQPPAPQESIAPSEAEKHKANTRAIGWVAVAFAVGLIAFAILLCPPSAVLGALALAGKVAIISILGTGTFGPGTCWLIRWCKERKEAQMLAQEAQAEATSKQHKDKTPAVDVSQTSKTEEDLTKKALGMSTLKDMLMTVSKALNTNYSDTFDALLSGNNSIEADAERDYLVRKEAYLDHQTFAKKISTLCSKIGALSDSDKALVQTDCINAVKGANEEHTRISKKQINIYHILKIFENTIQNSCNFTQD